MSSEEEIPPLVDYVALVRPAPTESKLWSVGVDVSNSGFVFEKDGFTKFYIHHSGRPYFTSTHTTLSPARSSANQTVIPRINAINEPKQLLFENNSEIRLNKDWSIGQLRPMIYNATYDVKINLNNVTQTNDNGFTLIDFNLLRKNKQISSQQTQQQTQAQANKMMNLNASLSVVSVESAQQIVSGKNSLGDKEMKPTGNLHSQLQQSKKTQEQSNMVGMDTVDKTEEKLNEMEELNEILPEFVTYYPCKEHNHNHVWYWIKMVTYFDNNGVPIDFVCDDINNEMTKSQSSNSAVTKTKMNKNARIRSDSLQKEYNYRNYSTDELLKLSVQCAPQPTNASYVLFP